MCSGYHLLIGDVICRSLLPFRGLPFCADGHFHGAKVFTWMQSPFVWFSHMLPLLPVWKSKKSLPRLMSGSLLTKVFGFPVLHTSL